jgi:hypothetical protein
MDSVLAPQDGQLYKNIINKVYSAPGVFERIQTWKDIYQHE